LGNSLLISLSACCASQQLVCAGWETPLGPFPSQHTRIMREPRSGEEFPNGI
jgi:hypothetical protein